MSSDLKLIKKNYGEKMMHLCRELFPTILENEGLLAKILLSNFHPNHSLYNDLCHQKKIYEFKSYIYNIIDNTIRENTLDIKTPEELLLEAGYVLHHCKTNEEIQSFQQYYSTSEKLCTFKDERLNSNHVFFAVKQNVSSIKREDFKIPSREDEYGTSVISIQFTKDPTHMLSIKNRYNHTVKNPDATFSNNLDNIIMGLSESFEKHYGMKQKYFNEFELADYVRANDGKYYKYNYEIYNTYYCPDNITIENLHVRKLPKEKYVLLDYFVLDLVYKKFTNYVMDGFNIEDIIKIEIKNNAENKEIIILSKNFSEPIILKIDGDNKIIGLKHNSIVCAPSNFLKYNTSLNEIEMQNLKTTNESFLHANLKLKKASFPLLEKAGYCFMFRNKILKELDTPSLEIILHNFLQSNTNLDKFNCPALKKVGNNFLESNDTLQEFNAPNLETQTRFNSSHKAMIYIRRH